ncbi:MAG: hypothetical protein KIS67_13175 [Verrucomicrobiae bacterium]|nr:hypothetical protein [Verrucomicrobiae bacterium]
MTDYFALLNVPRRPWQDVDSLKAIFLTQSARLHPDRIHSATDTGKAAAARAYAELNAAYHCLREPKDRLRHLLELELGRKPGDMQDIPPDLANWFIEIAQLFRQVNAFLTEKASVTSPLLQVQRFEQGGEWADRLTAVLKRLTEHQAVLLDELKALDAEWLGTAAESPARGRLLDRLEMLHQQLSFHARWSSQIQEAKVQLTF